MQPVHYTLQYSGWAGTEAATSIYEAQAMPETKVHSPLLLLTKGPPSCQKGNLGFAPMNKDTLQPRGWATLQLPNHFPPTVSTCLKLIMKNALDEQPLSAQ